MSDALLNKLLNSFDELERCINVTKKVLATKEGVPVEVQSRVAQYSSIVEKQRGLASKLKSEIDTQNWDEVGRLVKIINGLSSMIRDDAEEILAGATKEESSYKRENILS